VSRWFQTSSGALRSRTQEGSFVPGSTLASTRRLALAGMFAGLAWGAGYVGLIPNVELLTVILFVAGWVLGPWGGALAGALGEFLHSATSPYGSGLMFPALLVSQVASMAFVGAVGGWVGRLAIKNPLAQWLVVAGCGIFVTLVFDVLTNLASGFAFGQWETTLKLALPFALAHIGSNAALFATVGVVLVRALERTRRSLLPALVAFVALGCACALLGTVTAARAQVPVPPTSEPLAPPASADSLARPKATPQTALTVPVDSTAYRDASRAQPPPAWGEGPAALLRRNDGSLANALAREGGFVERFADDRGSAEPLGRFGLAGANRVLVDWLGLPLTGAGAVGGETMRVPWSAVARLDAPRLPVSATEAYRGELGAVRLEPFGAIARHPRVEGWAQTGSPSLSHNGFTATGAVRRLQGFLAVDAASLAPLAPLGAEGDHGIMTRFSFDDAHWALSGAYRSSRIALENDEGRSEKRSGEGGVARVARSFARARVALAFERTAESFEDFGDLIGLTTQRGRGGRATLRLESVPAPGAASARSGFGAFTYGRESLEAEGNLPFDRRAARFWWGSIGGALGLGAWTAQGALGAGRYGDGTTDFVPSLLIESERARATQFWAGAARGLSAAPDPRATDALGDALPGDPPIARSSTWLAGIGVTRRSRWWADGGSWRGVVPRGALSARTALYAGRSSAGVDPARFLFAGETVENAPFEETGSATRFALLTVTGSWAPLGGVTVDVGGHALGRTVDAILAPSDPEARAHVTLEGRHRFGEDGPDAGLAATLEWIGPRDGTPAGNLPAATRFGLAGFVIVDEFELRGRWGNVAGSNRLLPLVDPDTLAPRTADASRLVIEFRWTFWD
jgi:hypothetical protein